MHENLIVKHLVQALLKAKSRFCECSDTVFSGLIFGPFKQLPFRERKDQRNKQRKKTRGRGYLDLGITADLLETQRRSTLGKSLALSKPGFLHSWNEDTASVVSDL